MLLAFSSPFLLSSRPSCLRGKIPRDAGEMSSMQWQLYFYREVGKDAKE
jgi:hypothetical protein